MPRLTARDIAMIAVFLVGGAAVAALALAGRTDWALAALGIVVGLGGIAARLEFASRRAASRTAEQAARRSSRRAADDAASRARELTADLSTTRREIEDVRADVATLGSGVFDARSAIADAVAEIAKAAALSRDDLAAVREDVAHVRSDVRRVVRHTRTLETDLATDVQAITQLIARYAPDAPLPPVAGWALSPAGLLYVADSIERRDSAFVLECGSGTSTLWMALAMRRKGSGKVLAVEHLEEYAEKTRAVLETHGLSEYAEVRVCSLVTVSTPRGDFSWYDLDVDSLPGAIDLLLVDGPPGITGPNARYPALPLLAPILATDCLIVADDADRPDERQVLDFWFEESPALTDISSPARGVRVLATRPLGDVTTS